MKEEEMRMIKMIKMMIMMKKLFFFIFVYCNTIVTMEMTNSFKASSSVSSLLYPPYCSTWSENVYHVSLQWFNLSIYESASVSITWGDKMNKRMEKERKKIDKKVSNNELVRGKHLLFFNALMMLPPSGAHYRSTGIM